MSVLSTIKKRFSPYAFDNSPVTFDEVKSAFEAARWAPSGFNSQQWRFVFASKGEPEFDQLLTHAVDANREWMLNAGAVVAILSRTTSEYKGEHDPSAIYCTGLAVGQMLVEITALGLQCHQIGGFNSESLAKDLGLSPEIEPVAMMAIGKAAEEQKADRERKPLESLVFSKGDVIS